MKTKPTLYIVVKYNDDGDEIKRENFHIHNTDLEDLKRKFPGKEYDIFVGRHNNRGQSIISKIIVSR